MWHMTRDVRRCIGEQSQAYVLRDSRGRRGWNAAQETFTTYCAELELRVEKYNLSAMTRLDRTSFLRMTNMNGTGDM